MPQVPAVIRGLLTLGTWTKPNKRRFLLASPSADPLKGIVEAVTGDV